MKVRLYGYTVTLIEEQIYEGKAKYITSEESFNTTIDLRNYFKTNSIKNLKNNLPRYVGNILMKVSQKFADKLNSEGIYSATAKSYLDSVYTPAGRGLTSQFQTAFQRVFANNPQRLSSDEIEYLINDLKDEYDEESGQENFLRGALRRIGTDGEASLEKQDIQDRCHRPVFLCGRPDYMLDVHHPVRHLGIDA